VIRCSILGKKKRKIKPYRLKAKVYDSVFFCQSRSNKVRDSVYDI
jgi:hypothetical protein